MPIDVAIYTSEPEAGWISDAKVALATVGGLRVMVLEASHPGGAGAYQAVIVDAGGVENALLFIHHCHQYHPHTKIFMVSTEPPQWEDTRDAYDAGATDVIPKDEIEVIAQRIAAPPTILLADNKEDFRETWGEFLREEGYEVVMACSPAEATERIAQGGIDLAILDVRLEDDQNERDFSGLDVAKATPLSIPVVMATNYPTTDIVKRSLRKRLNGGGFAAKFIYKREPEETLIEIVQSLVPAPAKMPAISRDDEIDELYQKLAELRAQNESRKGASEDVESQIQSTFSELRKLQLKEAKEFEALAESRLLMPMNAGQQILSKIDELLKDEDENLTP